MKPLSPSDYTPEYVADRLQLVDLCTRYGVGVDRKDWDLFRSCFTDDAVIDYTAMGGPRHPRDAMIEWLSQVMQPFVGCQHFVLNQEIEIDGDTARGRIGFYNPMPLQTEDGTLFFLCGGWYIDEYRRTPEGWKISSRSEEFSFDTSKLPLLQNYESDQ